MTTDRLDDKLERSSIGAALREIEELGLAHHLLHLDEEMKPAHERKPCPTCGREL